MLNLWLPSAVDDQGRLRSWPAACRRGDHVDLQADRDVVVTLSTCPDDLFGSSQYEPGPVRVIVSAGASLAPPGEPTWSAAPGWPSAPPASALARNEVVVSLPDTELGEVDKVVAERLARLRPRGGAQSDDLPTARVAREPAAYTGTG